MKENTIFSTFFELWKQITKRRKIQLIKLLIIMLLSGAAEIFSILSIMPFISLITNPDILFEFSFIKYIFSFFGLEKSADLLIPVTLIFITTIICSNSIKLINLRANLHLSAAIGSDLSTESFYKNIKQSYEYHLNQNSSEMIANSTTYIDSAVVAIFLALQFFTAIIVSSALIIGLLLINTKIGLTILTIFLFTYYLISIFTKKRLSQNSKLVTIASAEQVRVLMEGLGSIRDLILNDMQDEFIKIYRKSDRLIRYRIADSKFIAGFPRYGIEGLGLISLSIISVFMVKNSNSEVLPLLGAFALGAQRLLPTLQQSFSSWAGIKSNNQSVLKVIKMTNLPVKQEPNNTNDYIKFKNSLKLLDIHFKYNDSYIFENINLEVKKGEKIVILGPTGSGKSTIIDLMMGLIKPVKGSLLIDDVDIYKDIRNLYSWRKNVSHVPQSVFLLDSTIKNNITFGKDSNEIDYEKLNQAIKIAQLEEFLNKTKYGTETIVGERGSKLSGGQSQRIGIARALYKGSEILFLDEATSALDAKTEKKILNSLFSKKELTIIMVTHRRTYLSKVDRIVELKNGSFMQIA